MDNLFSISESDFIGVSSDTISASTLGIGVSVLSPIS